MNILEICLYKKKKKKMIKVNRIKASQMVRGYNAASKRLREAFKKITLPFKNGCY